MEESLESPALLALCEQVRKQALERIRAEGKPRFVISPYRFNPLGAHVDHQGGQVLSRTLDQYTILCFWPVDNCTVTLHASLDSKTEQGICFEPSELGGTSSWQQMAQATVAALSEHANLRRGIKGYVHGTLISGGLSSSASVILAYLKALACVNEIQLDARLLVELCRRVENDYRGLNNGIQDQMSIAFAVKNSISKLSMNTVSSQSIADPANISEVQFLMLYSGVSRDLAGSSFNTRVAECQQAAAVLEPGARHLGEVSLSARSPEALARLPDLLCKRARHVYTEIARVDEGGDAWSRGDFEKFGRLMSASCESSINNYESGSEWLIALQEIALETPGILGSRFSGGGYGGCLMMLVQSDAIEPAGTAVLAAYLDRYPDRKSLARLMPARSEGTVRLLK